MSTNSSNYFKPYYISHPPPVYDPVSGSWSYNWKSSETPSTRSYKDDPTQTYKTVQNQMQSYKTVQSPPQTYKSGQLQNYKMVNSPTQSYRSVQMPLVSAGISRTVPSAVPVMTPTNLDQRAQHYYSSSPQGIYSPRRYGSSPVQYSNVQYGIPTAQYSSSPIQYNAPQASQYINSMHTSPHSYMKNYYNKRKSDSELDGSKKSNKKKKKPLSQNIPQRKDWSVEDARRALEVEKDYNKRNKSQSLIIKFPDIELNRDIVARFHSAIDSVHFQQPSTPRFCFVTLQDSADPEVVMKDLNKTPFGNGFLTAEFKKDREDEVNIGPEDIDPLTLYVGNLAQEVTKESMVNTYPRQKRIDIGYAKKMKYTRYAFVSFKCVDDSIDAFRRTHSTQMYSKSLIVRFRRLHGTVGMPGEPKPQMPPHRNESGDPQNSDLTVNHNSSYEEMENNGFSWEDRMRSYRNQHTGSPSSPSSAGHNLSPWEMVDVSSWHSEDSVDLNLVKEEPTDESPSDDEGKGDIKPLKKKCLPMFMPGSLEVAFALHRPKVKTEKDEDLKSHYVDDDSNNSPPQPSGFDGGTDFGRKSFPVSEDDVVDLEEKPIDIKESDMTSVMVQDKIKTEIDKNQKPSTYSTLRLLSKRVNSDGVLKDSPKEIKKEPSLSLDEPSITGEEKDVAAPAEEVAAVKNEPEDETNDGDKDDSSDDSDDFNFRNMLSSMQDRSKKLKKLKRS